MKSWRPKREFEHGWEGWTGFLTMDSLIMGALEWENRLVGGLEIGCFDFGPVFESIRDRNDY